MKNNPPTGPVAEVVHELINGMGYTLLEFSHQHVKGRTHVHCVLHSPGGIDLDALTEIHRALQPRLEALLDDRDLHIEFSSPGLERTLKSFHELTAFVLRRARFLPADGRDWITGTIQSVEGDRVTVVADDANQEVFTPEALTKVRLVD